MNRMQERYQKEVVSALLKAFQYKNIMQVPHIEKVVVNIGLGGEAMDNPKMLEAADGRHDHHYRTETGHDQSAQEYC